MPLLHNGLIINNDPWIHIPDEHELNSDQADFGILGFHRYLRRAEDGEPLSDGVCVGPAEDVSLLAPFVAQLRLICIDFPAFTDGRGYSHARLLRKRLSFDGELRAVGDIRVDQLLFLQRVGFDSFDCSALPDTKQLQKMMKRFAHNYQPSYQILAG